MGVTINFEQHTDYSSTVKMSSFTNDGYGMYPLYKFKGRNAV